MHSRTILKATEQQTEEVILALDRMTEQIGTTGFQLASAINRLATAVAPIDRDFETWQRARLHRLPPNGKPAQPCTSRLDLDSVCAWIGDLASDRS